MKLKKFSISCRLPPMLSHVLSWLFWSKIFLRDLIDRTFNQYDAHFRAGTFLSYPNHSHRVWRGIPTPDNPTEVNHRNSSWFLPFKRSGPFRKPREKIIGFGGGGGGGGKFIFSILFDIGGIKDKQYVSRLSEAAPSNKQVSVLGCTSVLP